MRTEVKYEKKIYELTQLLEISKVVNSTLNYNKLLDTILFSFMAQSRCVKAGLFIGTELEPRKIRFKRNHIGYELDLSGSLELDTSLPFLQIMAQNPQCYTKDEILPHVDHPVVIELFQEVDLIIPLVINGSISGIVVLGGKIDLRTQFHDDERRFLSDIGLFCSIAVQNSILFDMATVDMMTGLKMRHYLIKLLDEILKNGEHNFCLLMLDIDHFKQVNDTYGHSAGDDVIKNVSSIILSCVRAEDIAARYGGEEFVILLKDTKKADADAVAERIREKIEENTVLSGNESIQTTISIGVTEADLECDMTAEDVINRSDKALYISKNSGRNRVTTI